MNHFDEYLNVFMLYFILLIIRSEICNANKLPDSSVCLQCVFGSPGSNMCVFPSSMRWLSSDPVHNLPPHVCVYEMCIHHVSVCVAVLLEE